MPRCCTSPQPKFFVRNDGYEPLANDTRAVITLPAGVISAPGLTQIRNYLRTSGFSRLAYELPVLGDDWQTRTGNFAKRLSSHAYKYHGTKLPPDVLSQVGCIARDHSQPAGTAIEVTRQLNRSSVYFGNRGSCWWGSGGYGSSRCAFKTNGGFGLRSFEDSDPARDSYVTGRAWVLPLRLNVARLGVAGLTPTFATMTPDAFMVFNGYGALNNYTAPRILAHMAGWTYRKTGFACHPMYVNAGGYLVAPEDITQQFDSLQLSVERHAGLFETEQAAATWAAEQQTAANLLACFSRHTLIEENAA